MLPSSRFLASSALAAGLVALPVALAGPAVADLTQPSPLPSAPLPVQDPTGALPQPLQGAVTTLTGGGARTPTADGDSTPATGTGLPTGLPTAVPPLSPLPAVPALTGDGGGQSQAPAKRSTSSTGTASSGSPLGDDVLPAALEDELCAVLEQIMTPMPTQVSGLPATVIAQLPAQITDQVPADVLRVVTLRCSAPAASAPAQRPAADRKPTLSRHHHASRRHPLHRRHATATPTATSASALPHTGLAAGIPLAGLGLVLAGAALRRKARPSTGRA